MLSIIMLLCCVANNANLTSIKRRKIKMNFGREQEGHQMRLGGRASEWEKCIFVLSINNFSRDRKGHK